MAFLGNLFKKKPGGSLFGNILRGVASSATGGILGAGQNRIELGQTKTNAQLAAEQAAYLGVTPPPGVGSQVAGIIGAGVLQSDPGKAALASTAGAMAKKYWLVIVAVVGGIIYFFYNRNRKPRRPGGRR